MFDRMVKIMPKIAALSDRRWACPSFAYRHAAGSNHRSRPVLRPRKRSEGTYRNISTPSSPQRGEGARRADEGAGEAGLSYNAWRDRNDGRGDAVWPPHPPAGTFSPGGEEDMPRPLRAPPRQAALKTFLPSPSRAENSSFERVMSTAATFSSRCLTLEVPGIGSMTGLRFSTQASAIWLGAAL